MRLFFEELTERLLPVTMCVAEICGTLLMICLTFKCLKWLFG